DEFSRESRQACQKVSRSLPVDSPIVVRGATRGCYRVHDPVERTRQRFERLRFGNVAVHGSNPGGGELARCSRVAAQAKNLMAIPHQLRTELPADVTAADNQNAHVPIKRKGTTRAKSQRFCFAIGLRLV